MKDKYTRIEQYREPCPLRPTCCGTKHKTDKQCEDYDSCRLYHMLVHEEQEEGWLNLEGEFVKPKPFNDFGAGI